MIRRAYVFILGAALLLLTALSTPAGASGGAVELVGIDGFAGGCDPAINLAGITARFNTGPTTVKVRAQAYTDYLDEVTVIGPTAGGGAEIAFTINTPPDVPLPENTVVQFTIGNDDFSEAVYVSVNCTTGAVFLERLLGSDGRLLAGENLPVVIFPMLNRDLEPFLEFWRVNPAQNYQGRLVRTFNADTLAATDGTDQNVRVGSTPDGLATLYRLSTGEWQVNYAPNEEGKVYVVIFDALSPTSIRRADY
ncbi:MAG: hypothetical protein ACOCYT_05500 [Chloroflexota bacterium]